MAGALAALLLSPTGCRQEEQQPPAAAQFTDITRAAGISFTHDRGGYGRKLFPEMMGAGAAFFDANADGLLDVFLVNGAPLPGHPNPAPQPSRLYLNRGGDRFEDTTTAYGLDATGYGMGAAVGDVNNDGYDDLYLTRVGRNSLYLNREGRRFEEVTDRAGVAVRGFSSSAAFLDYDNDGWLDLYVCRYVPWNGLKDDHPCRNSRGEPEYCSIFVYGGMQSRLLRNRGDGRFEEVTDRAGVGPQEGRSLAVVCGDYDRNGWTDIFVANDEMPNFLWQNLGNGRFEERAAVAGFAVNERAVATAGMGLDLADADGDGTDDVIESDFQRMRKTLYVNDGHGFFTPNAANKGPGELSVPRLAFGVGFLDFDLDGLQDIFLANGHIMDNIAETDPGVSYAQPAQLLRNAGQAYYEDASRALGTYALQPRVGRGAAFGDYDNDGDTDLLISNSGQEAVLLRNDNPHRNHWLGVRCVGKRANRSGLGALVTLVLAEQRRTDETRAASSYLSSSDPRVLFGLGGRARVDRLIVRWPGGATQEFADPPVDRYVTVTEGVTSLE